MRIKATLDLPEDIDLSRTELGRAYVVPKFVQYPNTTETLRTTPILVSGFQLSGAAAIALKDYVSSGFLPLRVCIKVRGQYKAVNGSWLTTGDTLYGDEQCVLKVALSTTSANNNNSESYYLGQGGLCNWSVAPNYK